MTALGIDAVRHLRSRHDHLPLAALPLLFGAHQLDETLVWWGQQGHVSPTVGRDALWIYLVIAFVVLPIYVPCAVAALEPTRRKRLVMVPFILIGLGVSIVLLAAMIRGPISVHIRPYHLGYSIAISHGLLVVCFYVFAVCGALLFSGYRHIVLFGVINLIAVAVLARLTIDGFASLWCGYAALSSGAIALHMRFARPHRAAPYVLTPSVQHATSP